MTGVESLLENGFRGQDTDIFIVDDFNWGEKYVADMGRKVSHGLMVSFAASQVAPDAHIVDLDYDILETLYSDVAPSFSRLTIFNFSRISGSWACEFDEQIGFTTEMLKGLAKQGAFVVVAAGNEPLLFGASQWSRKMTTLAQQINEDETIDGAMVFVGAMAENMLSSQENSHYSAMAGCAQDSFVTVASEVFYLPSSIESENDSICYKNFKVRTGTSFAAPAISGAIAVANSFLEQQFERKLTAKELFYRLFGSLDKHHLVPQEIIDFIANTHLLGAQATEELQDLICKDHIIGRGFFDVKLMQITPVVGFDRRLPGPAATELISSLQFSNFVYQVAIISGNYSIHLHNMRVLKDSVDALFSDCAEIGLGCSDKLFTSEGVKNLEERLEEFPVIAWEVAKSLALEDFAKAAELLESFTRMSIRAVFSAYSGSYKPPQNIKEAQSSLTFHTRIHREAFMGLLGLGERSISVDWYNQSLKQTFEEEKSRYLGELLEQKRKALNTWETVLQHSKLLQNQRGSALSPEDSTGQEINNIDEELSNVKQEYARLKQLQTFVENVSI